MSRAPAPAPAAILDLPDLPAPAALRAGFWAPIRRNWPCNMVIDHGDPVPDPRDVQIAVLAKAPVPGLAKTRLTPELGARGAARLQRQLTLRTLETAVAARLGPVTLWCAPDARHRFFRALHKLAAIDCLDQPSGDLGDRMHAAFVHHCPRAPLLLIGTDCPALRPSHLREAARRLCEGLDAVFQPAEDGGYVLVGLSRPQPLLFSGMQWSTADVMAQTRSRMRALRVIELETLWDVDVPADLPRLRTLAPWNTQQEWRHDCQRIRHRRR